MGSYSHLTKQKHLPPQQNKKKDRTNNHNTVTKKTLLTVSLGAAFVIAVGQCFKYILHKL